MRSPLAIFTAERSQGPERLRLEGGNGLMSLHAEVEGGSLAWTIRNDTCIQIPVFALHCPDWLSRDSRCHSALESKLYGRPSDGQSPRLIKPDDYNLLGDGKRQALPTWRSITITEKCDCNFHCSC